MPPVVLFDACVLYPAPLRSLLMYLALTGVFRARWSEDIHAEWMRNVVRDHPDMTQVQVEKVRQLMDRHVPACLVVGYEPLIPALDLPDPDDRHVLAAAIHGRAPLIVTSNLRDFPEEVVAGYGVRAIHPDEFVLGLLEQHPAEVLSAVRKQRASLKNPPLTVEQFLASLERQGLTQTVAALIRVADTL